MTEEDEAFNEIEKRSKVKQDILMHPSKEAMLTAEVAVLTEMVRVLSDKIAELEAKQKQDNTYFYASSLATAIWQKHYIKESPKFALLDTTEGVLTQIDNMTCGLVREKPAQPEQEQGEPVSCKRCKQLEEQAYDILGDLKVANLKLSAWSKQRTWVGLTELERAEITKLKWWDWEDSFDVESFTRAIEAKLKEKNT
jgi:hypothetical protein